MAEPCEKVYYKNLFDNCRFLKNTSNILVPRECFWKMSMKPIADVATKNFPVDYQTFPEGTKEAINKLFWQMRKTTREAFFKIRGLSSKHHLDRRTDNVKAASIVMTLFEEAFSPLKLNTQFTKYVREMLVRLFITDITQSIASFDDYLYLFNQLPLAWYEPMDMLLMGKEDAKYKFDLLSTYFLRFLMQFVGDTTRILFCREDNSFWSFSEAKYETLHNLFLFNQAAIEKEELEMKSFERPVYEPVRKKFKITEPEKRTPNSGKENGIPEQIEQQYLKKLYDSCHLAERTSNILENKESFWDTSMKPETDSAAELFPVDYQKFPEGTKDMLNQFLCELRKTTRKEFAEIPERGSSSPNYKTANQEVAGVTLVIVNEAFSPLKLTTAFKACLRLMLCRLFETDISKPLATFEDFVHLFKILPPGWNDLMNKLSKKKLNGRFKIDLLSSYFLRFVIQFVGDTTRLRFRRIDERHWIFSKSEYDILNAIHHSSQSSVTEKVEERDVGSEASKKPKPDKKPVKENLKVIKPEKNITINQETKKSFDYKQNPTEELVEITSSGSFEQEPVEAMVYEIGINVEKNKDEVPVLEESNRHKMTLEESKNALLDNFPESLQSLKNVISQSLYDDNIPDEWKAALMAAVSTTNVLELQRDRAKENFNLLQSSSLDD